MIKIDKNLFRQSTKEAAESIKEKLEGMVSNFCQDVARIASKNTPLGEPETGTDEYVSLYEQRQDDFGIAVAGGFHKGAWSFYPREPSTADFGPEIRRFPAGTVGEDMEVSYRLGNGGYIAAVGPGYAALEKGSSLQAPDGIMQPSEQEIVDVYSANVASYYKQE